MGETIVMAIVYGLLLTQVLLVLVAIYAVAAFIIQSIWDATVGKVRLRRELEAERWLCWRPKQDLRHLPH